MNPDFTCKFGKQVHYGSHFILKVETGMFLEKALEPNCCVSSKKKFHCILFKENYVLELKFLAQFNSNLHVLFKL
jgi:hypothetical protein